jgi:glycerophosphoryl diester phosphodiesterase
MKRLYLLFFIFTLLTASCTGNEPDAAEPQQGAFTVEIVANNEKPIPLELIGFYIKTVPAGRAKTVEWNWGDGATSTGAAAQHSFAADGEYAVTVQAVSEDGYTARDTQNITVEGKSLSRLLKNFDRNRVWLCAHRCNTGDATLPENSISALKRAISLARQGVLDMVEIDPRMTSDGVMVLMHDATVDRTTTGSGSVSQLTYTQIQALRLRAASGVTNEPVPTLRDFLLAAKDSIFIDLDYFDKVPTDALYNLVKECGMLDQVMFYTSSTVDFITAVFNYSPPGIPFSHVSNVTAVNNQKALGVYVTQISTGTVLSGSLTESAAQQGMVTFSNTLVQNGITYDDDMRYRNDYSGVDVLIGKGINIIQTDCSPLVDTYLKGIGRR